MPAPLSVIIPTLNAAEALPETAEALLSGASGGLIRELVISDGGSEDETASIARELGAVLMEGPASRGGQLARGAAAAKGEWLLLLHADTHPAEGWDAAARAHMAHHPDKAGWLHLRFRAVGLVPRIVETGANLRSRLLGLPYGDQALLIRKELLSEIGGIPDLPLMEDVALARRLKGRLRPIGAKALTSADRYLRDGWARRVTRNLGTLARYLAGADPARLKQRYDKK